MGMENMCDAKPVNVCADPQCYRESAYTAFTSRAKQCRDSATKLLIKANALEELASRTAEIKGPVEELLAEMSWSVRCG